MHTLQPQKYLAQIGTLNNIKLTLREVDVISCVLSGKIAKTMSSILGIETRTYETHYANIKKKLHINTKEHLINLVEKSTSTLIYKNHASLLQIEKNILEYAQAQKLEHKFFTLHISQSSNQLFFDLLKRHLKLFNISIQIKKVAPKNTPSILDFVLIPTDANNQKNNTLHIQFQDNNHKESGESLYFKQDVEYFDFFITTIERLNPNINTFYIKQKISNILAKQSEGLHRIQEPVRGITTHSFQKSMNNIPMFKKIWMLIGAITSVSSLTLLIPSISTHTIIHNNLGGMHILGINKNILKRDELLSAIGSAFSNQKTENPHTISYVTLLGISGSGKTTLATHYAEQQTQKFTWKLNAQSYCMLRQSYLQLAYNLANTKDKQAQITFLEKIQDPKIFSEQLLRFIQINLKEQKNWLLIFDNVVNLQEIESFLPHGKNMWGYGNVIITSTNSNLEHMMPKDNQYIKIDSLSNTQAKDLFCSIVYKSAYKYIPRTEQLSVDSLLKEIPSFPLDVSLAAHYILYTHSTVHDYLNKLNDDHFSNSNLNTFFQQEFNMPLGRSSLLQISIKNILEVDKKFQNLLYILSRLHFNHIPKKLLLSYCDEDTLNAFILTLKKHSFITEKLLPHVHSNERFISIHPFIQSYCKAYLNKIIDRKTQELFIHSAVQGASKYEKNLPNTHYKILNILNEHIKAFLQHARETPSFNDTDLYHLYSILGKTYYLGSRELLHAKDAFETALNHAQKNNHIQKSNLDLYLNLANIFNDIVAPRPALLYAQKAIHAFTTTKPSHTQYERALFEQGTAYLLLGNVSEAEKSLQLALQKLDTPHTPDALELKSRITAHKGWMDAATNLTTSHSAIDDVNAALQMITDSGVLRLNIKTAAKLRAYHYVTKGDILCKQGKFEDALSLGFAKAQEVLASNLSESPHFVLNIYLKIGIGECTLRSGNFKKAGTILQDIINKGELLLGKDCPLLFAPKVLLMETFIRLNRLGDAEELLQSIQVSKTDNTAYAKFMECLLYYNAIILYNSKGSKIKEQKYFCRFSQAIEFLYSTRNSLPPQEKETIAEVLKTQDIDSNTLSICRKLLNNIYPNIKFTHPILIKE